MYSPANILAAILTLVPFFIAAFFPALLTRLTDSLSTTARLLLPTVLVGPYMLVTLSSGNFSLRWLVFYALLFPAISVLLYQASKAGPTQQGNWRDFLVLIALGLSVDLRWFEPAWPPR